MSEPRRRTTATEIGGVTRGVLGGRGVGAGIYETLDRVRAAARRENAALVSVANDTGDDLRLSGSAHGTGTGNTSILLTHDDAGDYRPWTVTDDGLSLYPPSYGIFSLDLTVKVEFTDAPADTYGAPNYQLQVPWGVEKEIATYYSDWVWIYNDVGGYASFAGNVVRAPDDSMIAWHQVGVTMEGLNPAVADDIHWEVSCSFEYLLKASRAG